MELLDTTSLLSNQQHLWYRSYTSPSSLTGFAVNLQLLLAHPDAHIDPNAQRGYLESSLLDKLVTLEELEPKAEDCTKVCIMVIYTH